MHALFFSVFCVIFIQTFGELEEVDPDRSRNVTELITSKGYPCDTYEVTTEDGFILSIQRITHGKKLNFLSKERPVVFLQHGLLSSAADWVINFSNQSLGYVLADAGFDVWLGNFRGSTYSNKHVKYSTSDAEFWAWSWDQMSAYDLPAMINFVLKKTGQKKLYYVGHSQGTLTMFAQTEMQHKLHLNFALAPIAYVKHIKGLIYFLQFFLKPFNLLFKLLGVHDFLPSNGIIRILARTVCKHDLPFICEDLIFSICGVDVKNLNETRLPVYLYHSPAGTSVQNIVHFSQMVASGNFQMYDYGSKRENIKHYGQKSPPQYYISNFTAPTVLYHGGHDWLADERDYNILKEQLVNVKSELLMDEWNHLDFIWAMNAKPMIYEGMVQIIRSHHDTLK